MGLACVENKFLKLPNIQKYEVVSRTEDGFIASVEMDDGYEFQIYASFLNRVFPSTVIKLIEKQNKSQKVNILVAPYISERTAQICEDNGMGYFDYAGNCWFVGHSIYLSEKGNKNPRPKEQRSVSIFERTSVVSSRILRELFADVTKTWKLKYLSEKVNCSICLLYTSVGAGRSELVNAVFGIIGKQSGAVMIDGREVQIRKPEDAIREGLALVTEDRKLDGFVGGMSIEENITLASLKAICRYGIINHKKEQLSARKYFDELKIKAADMTVHMETLSGGNQQKAVLSKWLMTKPRVLIMDEPTRGIDVGTKYEIYKIMVELARQGIAIIMISSELPELISMSDRIIVLSGGKVSGELQQEDASQEKVMELATRMVV